MLSLLASATLVFTAPIAQDDAASAPKAGDAKRELVALTGALAQAESYTFTTTTEGGGFAGGRGGFGGGRGGFGGGRGEGGGEGGERPEPPAPPVTRGTYKKGMPLMLSQGETVAYKDGEQLVHKNADGEWTLFDRESMRGGFGRGERGGRGGGEGGGERGGRGEGGGERGEGDRARFESMRAVFGLLSAEAPHGKLTEFGDKIERVARSDKDGKATFEGTLTTEAAEALARRGRGSFGGRGGRGGGEGGPQLDYAGSFVVVAREGAIQSVTLEVTVSGSFGEREFERTTTQKMTFAEIGKAKLEVPDAALAQFEI